MSIYFGDNTSSPFEFSEPILLSRWAVKPKFGGVYAILIPDQSNSPLPFSVIYFGKATSFAERLSTSHEKYPCWRAECTEGGQLYLALCPIATEEARANVESRLIQAYKPVCNERGVGAGFLPSLTPRK